MHGYDVVDRQRVNEELGGEEGHRRFCQRLKALGLGQVLNMVPNHMALKLENRYVWDVAEILAPSTGAIIISGSI